MKLRGTTVGLSIMSLGVLAACGGEDNNGAADYPEENIEIIVPYSAGGGGDTVARIISDALSDELDANINVVNRDGAGGEIGISEIANSDADGYTLGVFGYPDNLVLEHTTNTDFGFDDLEYLASFDDVAHALFAGPGSGFDSLEDMVDYAEENPGEVTVGESGALGLLKILAFEDEAGVDLTPVNYDGGGDLINALLGDHIEVASSSITAAPEVTGSDGIPLGYAAADRTEMFDEYPTMAEQGYDLDLGVARVLVAPEGLPDEVRDVLTEALNNIGEDPDFQAQFEDAELPYRYFDYDEVNDYLQNSNDTLIPLIEDNQEDFGGE